VEYGDVILLMSDGAYEKYTNDEISIVFASSEKENLKTRMNNYVMGAKKKYTNDNVSIIAIQIKQKKYFKYMESSTDNSHSSYEKIEHA
jgi:serine/threonine protein phosphatase PrpC